MLKSKSSVNNEIPEIKFTEKQGATINSMGLDNSKIGNAVPLYRDSGTLAL